MNITLEILKGARKLIEDEAYWTTRASARDEDGEQCDATAEAAVCWCVTGAVTKASHDLGFIYTQHPVGSITVRNVSPEEYEVRKVLGSISNNLPAGVNDQKGHGPVLEMLDEAIAIEQLNQEAIAKETDDA